MPRSKKVKWSMALATLLTGGLALALGLQPEPANANAKIQLCHFPPGNPANFQTIEVGSQKAADKHLEQHGDFLGSCRGMVDMVAGPSAPGMRA